MRKFLIKVLITSLPVLILLISVNFFGDAAKLFDSKYEIRMAEIITNGNYVKNISNYDERIFQKEYISKIKKSPEIIVLGSSRTMLIRSNLFPGKKVFNNSVSGASLEDLIAIYQIYIEHNLIPEKIIIGIDPWTFNDENGKKRWRSIESYYHSFNDKNPNSFNEKFKEIKYKELVSLSYFQPSFKNLFKKMKGYSKPEPTLEMYNTTNTKLTDGSLCYNADYRSASQNEINDKISSYISGNIYGLNNFNSISVDIWNEFQTLIKNIENKNIEVEFFLCPYAPLAHQVISKEHINVNKTEKKIKELAQKEGIKVYGSFNPFKLGFDETYFYDGMHCKEKGIIEILNN
jgi:hypothetical protein